MTSAVATDLRAPARLAAVPDPVDLPPVGEQLRAAGERVLLTLVDRLSAMALEKVDDLAAGMEDMALGGGVGVGAAFGAARAKVAGGNVVWGAIKGGFAALGTFAKVMISVVLALAPVLLVLALVVLIVALLVWAVVAAVRATVS